MSDLFDNAIDSLEVGIRFYLDKGFKNAEKHAILNVFHSIELCLKEKLSRINPLLIYRKIDKPIGDDSYTVGLKDILARYRNLGISIDSKQEKILSDLQRRRNRIEHHKFEPDQSHFHIIGKSLKFLYYFLPEHLGTQLEDCLGEDLFREVHKIILDYEERLAEAERDVKKRTTPQTKDDLIAPVYSAICPECGNHTVVIGTDRGNFCFFCREEVDMEQCNHCNEYFGETEINDIGLCGNCYTEILRRW